MKHVSTLVALGMATCATAASAQLRTTDLPPVMRPAAPPKWSSPARVLPSTPMEASSTLTRVTPALSVSVPPPGSLAVAPPVFTYATPPRVAPTVNVVVPPSPDPVETRKAATILPIENPRIMRVRREPLSTASRPCAKSGKTGKSGKDACK